jgi:alkaline phosphatase D
LGYISGDVTHQSALIWLRADAGSRVSLQFAEEPSFRQFNSTMATAVDPGADHSAIIPLDRLRPATRYYFRGLVSGKTPGPIASFVTAPAPADDAKVVFCFSGDTRESYQPFTVMQAVQAQRPDFFLHLGDTIYSDRGGNARSLEEFWQKYRANRSDRFSQNCFGTTSVYALWDDHEVADNYLPDHPWHRSATHSSITGRFGARRLNRNVSTILFVGVGEWSYFSSTPVSIAIRNERRCSERLSASGCSMD